MADYGEVEMDAICRMEIHTKIYCAKIAGYSLIRTLATGESIRIGMFHLAGFCWEIHFYPNGSQEEGFIALHLKLLTETTASIVRSIKFSLLDLQGKDHIATKQSDHCTYRKQGQLYDFSVTKFMKKTVFEASKFLNDDCLVVKLHLTVVEPFFVDATRKQIIVPLSDLRQDFGGLLESGEGADVTFKIDDEAFSAHRYVLAARSPVFKAQLFGSMVESKMDTICIEDMRADVFKIMLQFIYTDMLPSEVEDSIEIAQHLLVAADQYGLERLRLICEKKLCDSLDVQTAATILVLANQHNCGQLKDVCIDFVASRDVLDAVMETDGFKHLMSSSPLLLKEILDNPSKKKRYWIRRTGGKSNWRFFLRCRCFMDLLLRFCLIKYYFGSPIVLLQI